MLQYSRVEIEERRKKICEEDWNGKRRSSMRKKAGKRKMHPNGPAKWDRLKCLQKYSNILCENYFERCRYDYYIGEVWKIWESDSDITCSRHRNIRIYSSNNFERLMFFCNIQAQVSEMFIDGGVFWNVLFTIDKNFGTYIATKCEYFCDSSLTRFSISLFVFVFRLNNICNLEISEKTFYIIIRAHKNRVRSFWHWL